MKAKHLFLGLFKSIPGIEYVYNFHPNTGGSNCARYCYSVWMRHLVTLWDNGVQKVPAKLAELGPGDSLGIGMCALISGAKQYYALDVIRYTNTENNLRIFNELVELFRNRTDIPTEQEFPNLKPTLENYAFPAHIFTDLDTLLDEQRLVSIRESIITIDKADTADNAGMIYYRVPWNDDRVIEKESMDMIISQAVLQHVDNPAETYESMHKWLKPGGIMSHNIDLKSMGSANTWDGHWGYSDLEWKIVKGRKKYLINRLSFSGHIKLVEKFKFEVLKLRKKKTDSSFQSVQKMAPRFREMPAEDRTISSFFILAVKKVVSGFILAFGYISELSVAVGSETEYLLVSVI